MKKSLAIFLASLMLVGCSGVTDVPQKVEKKVEQAEVIKTENKVEKSEKISLAEQIPLSCLPSGEMAQSRYSQIDGRDKGVSVEFYLDCADSGGFISRHIFFAEQTSPENKQEKVFYYSFGNGGLKWQTRDGEIHTLAAKNDYVKECEGFGIDDPMKVLDLTVDGKELKALKTPIDFRDACLGDFQDGKFELKNFSEGILDLGGRKFEIDLEKGEAKEV